MTMFKKHSIFIVLIIVSVFVTALDGWSQYIPNAPFKPQYSAAPDFTLKDLQGKIFRLSAQRGKPVLIFSGRPGVPDAAPKCRSIKKCTKLTRREAWS